MTAPADRWAGLPPPSTPPATSWPPRPAPGDRYETVVVREDGAVTRRSLRSVALWGKSVLVAEDGRVWCDGCFTMRTVEELGGVTNSHRVGLPARAAGKILPMAGEDPDEAPKSPWRLDF